MSDKTAQEKSIEKIVIERHSWKIERSERICLIGLLGAEVTDPAVEAKRKKIIERICDGPIYQEAVMECTIGGCDVVVQQTKEGRDVSGECKAKDYCLKEKFEESGNRDLGAAKQIELYRDIKDTCMGFADSMSAGE